MELNVSHHEGYVVAQTTGPVDESCAELFREYLHPLVRERGTNLILDLGGSPRINSDGVSRIVLLAADANTVGSRVILMAPAPFVRNVFSLTKLDTFFEIVGDLPEAIRRIDSA